MGKRLTCPCGGDYHDDAYIEAGGFWVVVPDVAEPVCEKCGRTPQEAAEEV